MTPWRLDGANSAAKMAPRGVQEGFGEPQELPKGPQGPPQRPKREPLGAQMGPKRRQEGPKRAPRWPKRAPKDAWKAKNAKSKNVKKPLVFIVFGASWAPQDGPQEVTWGSWAATRCLGSHFGCLGSHSGRLSWEPGDFQAV